MILFMIMTRQNKKLVFHHDQDILAFRQYIITFRIKEYLFLKSFYFEFFSPLLSREKKMMAFIYK